MNAYKTENHDYKGFTIKIEWHYDCVMGPPWEEHDGHGDVSEWTTRDKRAGELVLCSERSQKRFYDFAGTIKKARAEGWGIGDEENAKLEARYGRKLTIREVTKESVMSDFRNMKAWCENDWHWCGYIVSVPGLEDDIYSLWSIESNDTDYHVGEALEVAQQAIDKELAARSSLEDASAQLLCFA